MIIFLKMKIGILTYPLNNNYGCYLQSYALLHYLKEKGYDVEYIFRRHDKPSIKFYVRYAMSMLLKNLKNFRWEPVFFNYEWNYLLKKGRDLYPFFEKYVTPHSEPIYKSSQLDKQCQNYNTIIVGSDQIWRAEILKNVADYFLAFLGDRPVKRIAYAASFGKANPGFTKIQIQSCGQAISKFCAVSVREDVGLDIIREYNWECPECKVVLDPTLLLNSGDYFSLLGDTTYPSVVFGYLLDQTEQKKTILKNVSEKLKTDSLNIINGANREDFVYPSVEEWLGYISKSRFVVTDSFHGMVFAILFNKPFAVIINKDRGAARFTSLLKALGLEDRVLESDSDVDRILNSEISWNQVNIALDKKRMESENFLLNSINE